MDRFSKSETGACSAVVVHLQARRPWSSIGLAGSKVDRISRLPEEPNIVMDSANMTLLLLRRKKRLRGTNHTGNQNTVDKLADLCRMKNCRYPMDVECICVYAR